MTNNSFDEEDFEFEDFVPATPIKIEEKKEIEVSTNEKVELNSEEKKESLDLEEKNTSQIIDVENIFNEPSKIPVVLEDKFKIVGSEEVKKPEILTTTEEKNIFESDNDEGGREISTTPSIKENTPKIMTLANRYSKYLPVMAFVFVSVLGIYIFINNVKADAINLIKIEEKSKVGYIDDGGEVIVKPKYLYGTDYHKGYAVVKNYNSLYGILDGKGKTEIPFGNIFSATLYDDRYIVSKFTNEGLKVGLLDSNLEEITRFKYDSISYSKSGVFLFNRDETMGLMNKDGKEIYTYKVSEVDDRDISVEVSNLNGDSTSDIYAKIKINSSSTIINTKTGKEVYKYTLDDIKVLDNNVFYIKKTSGNNKYFIIKDDKVVYETSEYLRLRVEDLNSNIAIAIRSDANVDYIDLISKKKINESNSMDYNYSDGIILTEVYDFNTNKNEYTISTPEKVLGKFSNLKPVDDIYVNGYMKIVTNNEKYTFIDKKGNLITNKEYESVFDFSENGFAIVSNDNLFGVINEKGKEIIDLKYDEIEMLDDDLFKNIKKITNKELFIFKEGSKYGIIDGKGKIVAKASYNSFETITTKYPIIKAKYNGDTMLINLDTFKNITIKNKDKVEVYNNYIVVSGKYYNYDFDLIYSIGG